VCPSPSKLPVKLVVPLPMGVNPVQVETVQPGTPQVSVTVASMLLPSTKFPARLVLAAIPCRLGVAGAVVASVDAPKVFTMVQVMGAAAAPVVSFPSLVVKCAVLARLTGAFTL